MRWRTGGSPVGSDSGSTKARATRRTPRDIRAHGLVSIAGASAPACVRTGLLDEPPVTAMRQVRAPREADRAARRARVTDATTGAQQRLDASRACAHACAQRVLASASAVGGDAHRGEQRAQRRFRRARCRCPRCRGTRARCRAARSEPSRAASFTRVSRVPSDRARPAADARRRLGRSESLACRSASPARLRCRCGSRGAEIGAADAGATPSPSVQFDVSSARRARSRTAPRGCHARRGAGTMCSARRRRQRAIEREPLACGGATGLAASRAC